MAADRWLNLVGLVLGLVGVVILFRYGMPFRVPTGGAISLIAEQTDAKAAATDRAYEIVGYVGLALLVVGTGLQIWAVVLSAKHD